MTLRTPRRRISPRTKRRYRAIREFFRRALGTSQQEIKINSTIAVNVTDLKRKIVGLEQQLDEVSRHCRDIACQDSYSRRESDSLLQSEVKTYTERERTDPTSNTKSNGIETQQSSKRDNSAELQSRNDIDNQMAYQEYFANVRTKKSEVFKEQSGSPKLHKHKTRSAYDAIATPYSENNFHSVLNIRLNDHDDERYSRAKNKKKIIEEEYLGGTIPDYHKDKKYKEHAKKHLSDYLAGISEEKTTKTRKSKRNSHPRPLDQEFIADIIRRQYQPVKLFGRKESDVSQITAPVCRDQEFSVKDNVLEDSELCSCVYGEVGKQKRSKSKRRDLSAMRSVCDARLYSSKKHMRTKTRRSRVDTCSNSDMYDFVPVKERSSPKSRRKFFEDNMVQYDCYKEVPPSPKSLRPRLNLKARYCAELEDYLAYNKHESRKRSPSRQRRYQGCVKKYFESDVTSEILPINFAIEKKLKHIQRQQAIFKEQAEDKLSEEQTQHETVTSSLQYPQYVNEQTSITGYSSINKTENEAPVDKTDSTDKTLSEIKQILQTFLQEIKKENITTSDKSDFSSKSQDTDSTLQNGNMTNMIPNSASFNAYSGGQCGLAPYMPPFANPCCYPVIPQVVPPVMPQVMCPMNCPMSMQNGYVMPSQSFTCTNCAKTPKETNSTPHCCHKNTETSGPKETDELIKEIYKFVAQTPDRKTDQNEVDNTPRDSVKIDGKMLTSRSAGDSFNNFQHDVKIGTPALKLLSKSCEAIASRMISEQEYTTTNASYSETLLEKISYEAATRSETELETTSTDAEKNKPNTNNNKFSKAIRSGFGLLKKKKKDVIEEVSEGESVVQAKPKAKPRSPVFRQEVTNYVMHGQEYYQPPPHLDNQQFYEYQQQPYEYPPRGYNYPPQFDEYHQPPREYQKMSPPEYYAKYQRAYSPPRHEYVSPVSQRHVHKTMRAHLSEPSPSPSTKRRPTAPPYSSSYDTSYSQLQPPLCLREIEVKSTGTQSERKMSIFRKIKTKMQPPVIQLMPPGRGDEYHQTYSTQTQQAKAINKPMINTSKPLFNWKGLQAKAMERAERMQKNPMVDPVAFSIKAQNDLARDNQKMRKVVLKKLFYKRNPFSPRNLIVRTLLGKDKSSFGEPPQMMKPRMFF